MMQVGYLASSLTLIGLCLASLVTQLAVKTFHPVWWCRRSTETVGPQRFSGDF
jgi:uncharacterized membrane-anchored protein